MLLLALGISTPGAAQVKAKRPKIGLALSGGGARSMAHIGVLRELEAMNIQIDYISGTSMGAVIGAMYAMGYSVDQIEMYLKHVDWNALMDNSIPRNRISVLDREDEEKYLLEFSVRNDKINAPDALNKGQYILKELSFLSWPVHGQDDFSKFKIPFLCMTTDLESGESVVLEQGDLAEALRASVAFPSLFSPFEIDGHLYVDGGVRNNLPILVLKEEKGMDVVIAVDVQSQLYDKEELKSAITILEQVGSFQNALYSKEQQKYADVLIIPGVMEIGMTDYQLSDTAIVRGARSTRKHRDQLKSLSRKETEYSLRNNLRTSGEILINGLEVEGNRRTTDRFVRSKLKLRKPRSLTAEELEEGVDKLYGSKYYDYVWFNLLRNESDTTYSLKVKVRERDSDLSIGLGLHYDDDFGLGVLTNITLRNAILSNSKFSIDMVLSENPRGRMRYIYDRGFIPSIGMEFAFHRFGTRIYSNREPITSLTYQDFSVNAFLTSTVFDNYTVGVGARFENVHYLEDFNTLGIGDFNNNFIHYYAFLNFDSFDRSYKAQKGFKLKSEIRAIARQKTGTDFLEPSSVTYLRYDQAISISNKVGLNTMILGAATIGGNLDLPYNVYLGGLGENYNNFIFPFLGYRYMELIGRNAAVFRADLYYEPFRNHFFTVKGNIGKIDPSIDGLFNSDILLDGFGLSYGYNSPFGPLEFTVIASSNHRDLLTYLSLGFWF